MTRNLPTGLLESGIYLEATVRVLPEVTLAGQQRVSLGEGFGTKGVEKQPDDEELRLKHHEH